MTELYFYLWILFLLGLVVSFAVAAVRDKKSQPATAGPASGTMELDPAANGDLDDPQSMDMTDFGDADENLDGGFEDFGDVQFDEK
jgi:hypothetical protein